MSDIDPKAIILTAKEVAELLKTSERTIRELSYRERIPHFQVGRKRLYRLSEIHAWLDEECRVPGTPVPKRKQE